MKQREARRLIVLEWDRWIRSQASESGQASARGLAEVLCRAPGHAIHAARFPGAGPRQMAAGLRLVAARTAGSRRHRDAQAVSVEAEEAGCRSCTRTGTTALKGRGRIGDVRRHRRRITAAVIHSLPRRSGNRRDSCRILAAWSANAVSCRVPTRSRTASPDCGIRPYLGIGAASALGGCRLHRIGLKLLQSRFERPFLGKHLDCQDIGNRFVQCP